MLAGNQGILEINVRLARATEHESLVFSDDDGPTYIMASNKSEIVLHGATPLSDTHPGFLFGFVHYRKNAAKANAELPVSIVVNHGVKS